MSRIVLRKLYWCVTVNTSKRATSPSKGKTMKYEYLVEHHGLKADSCVDATLFTEQEAWDMFESGDVTYDEADHMTDGMSLIEARAILASYICDCDICGL